MYAVMVTDGKQYRVQENGYVLVEKQPGEVGASLEFDNVLLVANGSQVFVGEPYIKNCTINATIEAHGRHKKIKILKFKRRKHHMKRMGHRQWFTKIRINQINLK